MIITKNVIHHWTMLQQDILLARNDGKVDVFEHTLALN